MSVLEPTFFSYPLTRAALNLMVISCLSILDPYSLSNKIPLFPTTATDLSFKLLKKDVLEFKNKLKLVSFIFTIITFN